VLDLKPLRNATDRLTAAAAASELRIHITARNLFSSIDQLRDAVDELPLFAEEIDRAGDVPVAVRQLRQKLSVFIFLVVLYIQLYSPRMVENKMKKREKREAKQYVPYRKKLDYDLTNIHNSLANSVDL